jgi:hypothetical protein
MHDEQAGRTSGSAVLADVEAYRRRSLLTRLQAGLAGHGVRSVLVGRHVLTLRAAAPFQPSGPSDPELHLLDTDRQVVTTDGAAYHLSSGHAVPADDPAAAAARLAAVIQLARAAG